MLDSTKPKDSHKGLMPYQNCPDSTTWCIWKQFLNIFCTDFCTLSQSLGTWVKSGDNLHRQWNFTYSRAKNQVYICQSTEHKVHKIANSILIPTGQSRLSLPADATPCDVIVQSDHLRIHHWQPVHQVSTSTPGDFDTYLDLLPEWERLLLTNVQLHTDVFATAKLLNSDNTMNATSDGSAPNFVGSFGWSAKTTSGIPIASNKGAAQGYKTSSFRAEAYGLLSFYLFIYHISHFTAYLISSTTAIYSDSKSVIDIVNEMSMWKDYYSAETLAAEWDILQALTSLLQKMPKTMELQHIKGHQDNQKRYEDLELPAQLNVDADKLAGSYTYPDNIAHTHTTIIKGAIVLVHTPDGTINSKFKKHLQKMIQNKTIKKYIKEKQK